jgi:LuxR family maltose regulon positive regulatory protein
MMATNEPNISNTLLKTKLHIPQARPALVHRPRLIDLINRYDIPCFTLVSAPAGFGKTTLLSDWVRMNQVPAAWISLDANDNDPVRFLSYVSAALMTVDPTVGDDALAAIRSPQPISIDRILALLINDVAEYSGTVALVFDDYQFIESEDVHQALFNVIERLPPNMHVLLATRIDPPWPLARFRARGTMNEIRASDLRFTATETGAFLNEIMDLSLSTEEIARLGERTEGWIAGLQMLALSLQDRVDRTQFIKAFSGSHRYILDYLMEEVLERQPTELRTFLLETSILERMCAPLCQHITGQTNAQEILEKIDHSNLFLVPLDDDRRWYRYHHLFADLLRTRLKEIHPDRLLELHREASTWFEQRNLVNEAIQHGFEADDKDRSIHLIKSKSLELVFQGGLRTLERWLQMLPKETVANSPRLCLAQAWVCVYSGNIAACKQTLDACEQACDLSEKKIVDEDIIRGQLLGVRAYTAWFEGDIDSAEAYAREALSILPESDTMGRAWASEVLGAMLRTLGDFDEAQKYLEHAIEISTRTGALHIAIDAYWELSVLTYYRGQLDETMRICQQALDLANQFIREGGRRLPVTGYIYTRMAFVSWARGELDRALEYALEGTRLSERWGFTDVLVMSYLAIARVYSSRGEYDQAQRAVQRAKSISTDLSEHYLESSAFLEALINLQHDNLQAALDWKDRATIQVSDSPNFPHLQDYRILAHVHVAQATKSRSAVPDNVIEMLVRLDELCDQVEAHGHSIEVLLTLVLAWQANNQDQRALESLKKAIRLAQGEGYIQPFIQNKAQLLEYLRTLHRQDKYINFINKILEKGEMKSTTPTSRSSALLLIEELSERELDVLRYLPSQLSTSEIAEELYIATSTVRSHIKSIYGKLDVHNRREAVARAQELDLL